MSELSAFAERMTQLMGRWPRPAPLEALVEERVRPVTSCASGSATRSSPANACPPTSSCRETWGRVSVPGVFAPPARGAVPPGQERGRRAGRRCGAGVRPGAGAPWLRRAGAGRDLLRERARTGQPRPAADPAPGATSSASSSPGASSTARACRRSWCGTCAGDWIIYKQAGGRFRPAGLHRPLARRAADAVPGRARRAGARRGLLLRLRLDARGAARGNQPQLRGVCAGVARARRCGRPPRRGGAAGLSGPQREADRIFPIDGLHDSFAVARPAYAAAGAAERLDLGVYPGGHGFTAEMRSRAYAWLDRWLRG